MDAQFRWRVVGMSFCLRYLGEQDIVDILQSLELPQGFFDFPLLLLLVFLALIFEGNVWQHICLLIRVVIANLVAFEAPLYQSSAHQVIPPGYGLVEGHLRGWV